MSKGSYSLPPKHGKEMVIAPVVIHIHKKATGVSYMKHAHEKTCASCSTVQQFRSRSLAEAWAGILKKSILLCFSPRSISQAMFELETDGSVLLQRVLECFRAECYTMLY